MPTCRLCLKEKKLIKAHIIPNFMYKGIKDITRFNKNLDSGKFSTLRTGTGEFDKSILCADCDNGILNERYEKYAKRTMYDTHPANDIKVERIGNLLIFKNIEYSKYKLFFLSILWRASISKRPFFERLNLGEQQEERLRKMLYEDNVPKETEYAIVMNMVPHFSKVVAQLPMPIYKGIENHLFIIDSIVYHFFITSKEKKLPPDFSKLILKESGEFPLLQLTIDEFDTYIKSIIDQCFSPFP